MTTLNIFASPTEYRAGKHKILAACWDSEPFSTEPDLNVPYVIHQFNASGAYKKDCWVVRQKFNKRDEFDEGKHYIDDQGQLCENEGWVEYVEELP